MNLQVYADKVISEHEHSQMNVYLENVDLSNIVSQISVKELLYEITINDGFSQIVDYVNKELNDES